MFLKKKSLKACLEWKVHFAYLASLQKLHSNTSKQIIQIQHNRIKKPQLAGGKRGGGFELGTTKIKSSKWPAEGDSKPGPGDCESDVLTTWPRCLP